MTFTHQWCLTSYLIIIESHFFANFKRLLLRFMSKNNFIKAFIINRSPLALNYEQIILAVRFDVFFRGDANGRQS